MPYPIQVRLAGRRAHKMEYDADGIRHTIIFQLRQWSLDAVEIFGHANIMTLAMEPKKGKKKCSKTKQ